MIQALTFPAARVSAAWLSMARLWRAYPREAVVVGALGFAALAAFAGAAWSTPGVSGLGIGAVRIEAVPAPPSLLVRPLAPETALSINRTIPIAASPNPAAKPFALQGADKAAQARALECLTSTVYYEAGNESAAGQQAVAQVVLNRVRHPAFPSSVCAVVYEGSTRATGCQFTFTCDGSLNRRPSSDGWARARQVAAAALGGAVYAPAGYATHYHADYVVPYWAASLAKNAVVGAHIFYRWAGGWGRPGAFTKRYSANEPNTQALKEAALAAEAAQAAAPASVAQAVAAMPGADCSFANTRRAMAVCSNSRVAELDRNHALLYSQSWRQANAAKRALLLRAHRRSVDHLNACVTDACNSGVYLAAMRELSAIMTAKVAASSVLHSEPSFSCRFAQRQGEVVVCSDPNLSALDRQKALLYSQSWGWAGAAKRSRLLSAHERFVTRREQCGTELCISKVYLTAMSEITGIMSKNQFGIADTRKLSSESNSR